MYSTSPAVGGLQTDEESVETVDKMDSSVHLELDVTDPESIRELRARKRGRERTEYSLNALTVGLLSLRHARGQVDADAVRREGERILADLGASLEAYRGKITEGFASVLKEYFDPNSGSFQQRVERLIKKDGDLEQVLRLQVGAEGSVLANALATYVGENSPIMNVLDPAHADSVVHSIRSSAEEAIKAESERILNEFSLNNKNGALVRMISEMTEKNGQLAGDLTERINEAVAEFSLDREGSALSRLLRNVDAAQKTITKEFSLDNSGSALARLRQELPDVFTMQNIKTARFQNDVSAALESMRSRREESLRSTRHGNDFEEAVLQFVFSEANRAGDIATATGSRTGLIKNCKIGDAVVELGPDCAAAGVKFVVEAKESASYDLRKAREEIEIARNNRGAKIGVFVFSKRTAPENVESIARFGESVFVVWDADDIGSDIVLKSALSLAKALCVREAFKRTAEAAEFEAIDTAILAMEKESRRLDEMRKWTETIKSNSEKMLEAVRKMSEGIHLQTSRLKKAVDGLEFGS